MIASDEVLPDLAPHDKMTVDIYVRRASSETSPLPIQWFMHWYLPKGELWLSFAKMNGDYLLRFNELADFSIRKRGSEIVYLPKSEMPPGTIYHLLLDQVIPLVINLRGGEALHTSALLMKQGVVAFAGPTGSGKSTLAGTLHNAGYPFVSDDCLTLVEKNEGIYAIPAYPGLRLWGDALDYLFGGNGGHRSVAHYTNKLRVPIERKSGAYCTEPHLLKQLYVIANPPEGKGKTEIVIEHLSPRESFMALIQHAFRLDITDRDMLQRQFHFLKRVASCVSVRRLIFPKDFDLLPAVREAILTDLQDLDNE